MSASRWIALLLYAAGCTIDADVARPREGGAAPLDAASTDVATSTEAAADAPLPTESGTDAGGTGTLQITGDIEAEADSSGATNSDEFTTTFTFAIARAGSPVEGATVTLTSSAGTFDVSPSGGAGGYATNAHGYVGTYALDVTAGSDRLVHAVLVGPAPHYFSAPGAGATVRAGAPLTVAWAPSGAASATIAADSLAETTIGDTGTYPLPSSALVGNPGNVTEDRLRVRRGGSVLVPGAAAGSTVLIRVRNEVDFRIDAT